jgi:hypothetical protein
MATFVILALLWLKQRQGRNDEGANLYLSISRPAAVAGSASSTGSTSGSATASTSGSDSTHASASERATDNTTGIQALVDCLTPHCDELDLKRFDIDGDAIEASFLVRLNGFGALADCHAALRALDPSLRVVFVDQDGIGSIDA